MNQTNQHYSYRIYADPDTARRFDSERFGGVIGQLIKSHQEEVVFSQLPSVQSWKVIDVGAGTGRFTIPLLERGAEVTACDASEQMLQVLKEKTNSKMLHVVTADAHHLQFPDESFDCAVSFRMLLHVVDWQKALSELCRVSREWVIFDLPPRHGFLTFAPLWHEIKSFFARNVQAYQTFRIHEVERELQKNGFRIVASDPGFFLPLTVHRVIGSTTFTRFTERIFSRTGLTRLAGSPLTLFARRTK